MAQLFPPLEQFPNLRQKPTEGESHLINFLVNNLDDSYEIYFQPFLNGDRPDIVLMRKNSGVMIIEVKDWHLRNYRLNQKKQWEVTKNGNDWYGIKSPIDQALAYKQNLYDLHIENLLEKNIREPKYWAIVTCAVYFHCETEEKINHFLTANFSQDNGYLNFLRHQVILGHDSLTKQNFNKILYKNYLSRTSKYFDDQLYSSFKRYLQPPYHTKEEGKELNYTDKQKELIVSQVGQKKAKGSAGSGKTCVLAKRAVNALKRIEKDYRTHKPIILILTYNITLINYIHDRISEVREDFYWGHFHIINYNDFITQELNNLGVKIDIPDDFDDWDSESRSRYFEENYYSNVRLFTSRIDTITENNYDYPVIFVDEIQDYKREWVEIIKKCYLQNNGEYVVFGDEKQNVYERKMEQDKKPYTGIGGGWNLLKTSFRLSSNIADLASQFQQTFFNQKYEVEKVEIDNQKIFSGQEHIEYLSMPIYSLEKVVNFIKAKTEEYCIHPNDISIQGSRVEFIRDIDYHLRKNNQLMTTIMSEYEEMYYRVLIKSCQDYVKKYYRQDTQDQKLMRLKNIFDQLLGLTYLFGESNNSKKIKDNTIDKMAILCCFGKKANILGIKRQLLNYLQVNEISENSYWQWFENISIVINNLKYHDLIKNRWINELNTIRKYKKRHFWMNTGNTKFSTIHSFKGWEVDTLFLLIEKESTDDTFMTDELIYTAITRCRNKLFIIDLDGTRYQNFFESFLSSTPKLSCINF
ncbi:nuclease-related domain-containing DEAD/DEAH box helicase [Cyanobacterium sp. Dongsha4]|uniref:nuclease-related domain-containing DEAD/DEAH box helicase n=1 Tax=Cyanobacterium sp. DS4 TaxID=2878255 RepID=UPI002E7FFDAD|nr:NERD domain-containing protein [Cyanobacterium sp. Dongsha4]WVK99134.1 NERD domain-containing protein [Cyanobacterium sp. Dongsha4]